MKNIKDAINMVKMAKSHKCLCEAVDKIDRMFLLSSPEIEMSDDDWNLLNLVIKNIHYKAPNV